VLENMDNGSALIGTTDDRSSFMLRAVELALRGKGRTAPNPCVGAVLARDGLVVAEGWHREYGGPHAEVDCLADARRRGVNPAQCELFVTLEPCNHWGRTPPCTKAILEAGIRRVVVGTLDPNPTVEGGGAVFLRDRDVEVEVGLEEAACREAIEDFLVWQASRLPYVYLKMAMTLDGKIAGRDGLPARVTGDESGRRVQELRRLVAAKGAVLVGGGTFRADDPRLTCRPLDCEEDFEGRQPLAVVVTRHLPEVLPNPGDRHYLLQNRPGETIFLTSAEAAGSDRAKGLADLGCRVWGLEEAPSSPPVPAGQPGDSAPSRAGSRAGLDLGQGLERLRREAGCWYVLAEGGGRLAWSLAGAGLAHEVWLMVAPRILGDEQGRSVFAGRGAAAMDAALGYALLRTERLGEDVLMVLKPKEGVR
jgi:diaminohydroxyphosphoribosylaminopyrimidine deaminase/5-amino-6-(5-phosphoribosylamino)uracil reductase